MARLADRRVKIELLRAAEATFSEHGLSAAKVAHITARAGVSKGAFYLHFQSKDDCFRQIVEGFLARLADCVEPPPGLFETEPGAADAFLARVHAHDTEVLEFCWQNRTLLRMMLAGGGGAPYAYLVDELAERIARQVEQRIRQAIDAGLYRADLDPAIAATMVSGAYDRLVRSLLQAPSRPDIAAWCSQAIQLFTHGMLAPEARAVADRSVTPAPQGAPPDRAPDALPARPPGPSRRRARSA